MGSAVVRPAAQSNPKDANMIRLTLLILGLCFSGSASACRSSPAYPPEAVGGLAKDATFVVEATLALPTTETSGHFKVHSWLKGNGSAEIEIAGFGHGTDCRSAMYRDRSILFLSMSAEGTYKLRELGTYSGMRPATNDNIRAIVGAVAEARGGYRIGE